MTKVIVHTKSGKKLVTYSTDTPEVTLRSYATRLIEKDISLLFGNYTIRPADVDYVEVLP